MPSGSSAIALSSSCVAERRVSRPESVLPLGRRTPKGRLRWYLVEAPRGRERVTCQNVCRVLPADVLEDAFVPMVERWVKRAGTWSVQTHPLYAGYFFAAARDADALDKALQKVTLPTRMVGSEGRFWSPVADDALAWLGSVMDSGHVVRTSTAEIVDGTLRVTEGPLAGHEASVVKIDRHRRSCMVRVGGRDGAFTVTLPLCVPRKS